MNIYVGNLHPNVSEAQLKELFKQFGEVISVKIVMNRDSGRSKKFGFVKMARWEDGMNAIMNLHNQNFMNQYLDVKSAQGNNLTQGN